MVIYTSQIVLLIAYVFIRLAPVIFYAILSHAPIKLINRSI